MRFTIKSIIILFSIMIPVSSAISNNLNISNVSFQNHDKFRQVVYIAFDLDWENSWRNNINHDAAWVFVKFRPPGSNVWEHAILSSNDDDHIPADNCAISAAADGTGVFIYSAHSQTGDVSFTRVRLKWEYGEQGRSFEKTETVAITVQALEMVYVPESPFYLGSGGTEDGSFTDGARVTGPTWPLAITSETALAIAPEPGKLWGTSTSGNNSIGAEGELPAAFPKGFQAFYCMKYPVTEHQYTTFLNLLTPDQAVNRFPNKYGTYRHTISFDGSQYETEAPDRSCGYLRWIDGSAYLDWAGLRPMTEMEFEKACRGAAAPVPNECAWGTSAYTLVTGIDGVDGSGTETALPINANCLKSSSVNGLLRSGIFATNNADRVSAGASYWGIMELSSHPCLLMVSVGITRGREFEGSHGDGTLSDTGHATNSDWPGYSTVNGYVSGTAGFGFRGADWNNPNSIRPWVSDRGMASANTTGAYAHHGCRGVRSIP